MPLSRLSGFLSQKVVDHRYGSDMEEVRRYMESLSGEPFVTVNGEQATVEAFRSQDELYDFIENRAEKIYLVEEQEEEFTTYEATIVLEDGRNIGLRNMVKDTESIIHDNVVKGRDPSDYIGQVSLESADIRDIQEDVIDPVFAVYGEKYGSIEEVESELSSIEKMWQGRILRGDKPLLEVSTVYNDGGMPVNTKFSGHLERSWREVVNSLDPSFESGDIDTGYGEVKI